MKKYLLAVLILIIAVSAPIYAEDSTVFTVEPSVSNGVVTVDVLYSGNTLMQGGSFDFIFDTTKMKVKEVSKGNVLANALCDINENFDENKIRFVWIGQEIFPDKGTIAKITLELFAGEFKNSDISVSGFEICNPNSQVIKTASMSVKGVEGSTIYSGQVTETEDKKEETPVVNSKPADTKPEESAPATGSNADNNTSAEGQKSEVNKTDETLPLDKVPSEEEAALGFIDVTENDWFFDSVKYAKDNKLMSGVSETEFAPNASVTRAMLVVVLHRIEGEPVGDDAHIVPQFTDVENGQWYTNAVAWAASEGIVNGVGDNMFAPNADITREQIATILYKYSQKKSAVEAASVGIIAPDRDKISDWAMEGMSWAVAEKLITGKDGGVLDPGGKATRAEIATILMRYLESVK